MEKSSLRIYWTYDGSVNGQRDKLVPVIRLFNTRKQTRLTPTAPVSDTNHDTVGKNTHKQKS